MAAGPSIGLVMIFLLLVVGTKAGNLQTGWSWKGFLHPHRRLFVFGDSFADTGNVHNPKGPYFSLGKPYGETYPGFPTGRWSDGKVMTDFVAEYLHLPSPVPYSKREQFKWLRRYGMNFAYAGTGVFDTFTGLPDMTQQIDAFEQLIKSGLYAEHVNSSVAFVSYAGNDYLVYLGLYAYGHQVVQKLAANLQRLQDLGVKKVAVTTLPPSGCIPIFTYSTSFSQCVSQNNNFSALHNQLLNASVRDLSPPVVVLDNYNAFLTVLQQEKFGNRLRGCCMGVNATVWCGQVDGNGQPQYTLCPNPWSTFWNSYEEKNKSKNPSTRRWKNEEPTHHPSPSTGRCRRRSPPLPKKSENPSYLPPLEE
ncbi:GDSL esterase/lipase At5g03610-like isoform X2 [Nymphaea colorata]|uniref:GDSL esterase/lipase At5g03610-like isoform X2 n=1 Tax=Nymphaea colorata TaxID=210225 RepID=UPI00129D530A|nr:GDSL esterase/lipase At5g03610-like isoform X2 [Nymphaea colorata]